MPIKKIIFFLILVGVILLVFGVAVRIRPFDQMTEGHLEVSLDRGSYFGKSVELGKNILAVSAYSDSTNEESIVYLFEKKSSGWGQIQKISGNDIDGNLSSIEMVSLHDAALVTTGDVGDPDLNSLDLYFFRKRGNKWVHTQTENIQSIRTNTSDFRTTQSYFQSVSFFGDNTCIWFP